MQSTAETVTAYLDEVPAERKVALVKGCIRYSRPERIDFKVVEMMLKATQESTGVICGHTEPDLSE